MFKRLVCCGPGSEANVYYSDEDSSDCEFRGGATATVIRWPHGAQPGEDARTDFLPLDDAGSLRVLPSDVKDTARKSRRWHSERAKDFVPRRETSLGEEDDKDIGAGAGALHELVAGYATVPSSLRNLLSPTKPKRHSSDGGDYDKRFFTVNDVADKIIDDVNDPDSRGSLNLAYRETRRLPDVAGNDRMAWAAGVLRIDLTETNIRTLRGLDAFPNVHSLVLDGNGLLSLPMDCPWCPAVETLWMCNNDVENLDGLLSQITDVFPRLKSLALMGNPVWPAAKSRSTPRRASLRDVGTAAGRGLREGRKPEKAGEEEEEEAAYRLHVIRKLPGLLTLDCADVTAEERNRAKETGGPGAGKLMDVSDLLLEAEPVTDVEKSLPREERQHQHQHMITLTAAGSTKSVSHGVSKLLEGDRERRANLPDRSSLPSTWYKEAVVMDVGSGWTRMGLAGQDTPSCVFPTLIGRVDLKTYDRIAGQDERVYVGHHAVHEANKRAAERELPSRNGPMPSPILLHHPLSNGVVTDWDDMEELWRFGIEDEMGLDAVEHPVLMADSTATDPSEREKATEVLFETLSTPALHMALQPVLALYACGPTSGLVVDIGDSGTQVVPIFDGFVLEAGIRWVGLGGKDITRNLAALVNAKVGLMGGDDFEPDDPCDALKLEDLKASVCFVSEDVDRDNARMELSMSKPYTLPDGTRITLGRERYRAAEVLFDPAMNLREEDSLQNTVLDSVLSCDRKAWSTLAQTVILTGGTTMMVGLNRRLQRELTKTSRANGVRLKYTVMVPEDDHNNTVWIGGSMLASAGGLDGLWFTRAEYEEYGAGHIHSKFAA